MKQSRINCPYSLGDIMDLCASFLTRFVIFLSPVFVFAKPNILQIGHIISRDDGVGSGILKVTFTWDDVDDHASVKLQPTRFKRADLGRKWNSNDLSLADFEKYLEQQIAPCIDHYDYSCSISTVYTKSNCRYKGNPFFQNGGAWHDWAYFQTDKIGKTLCHIL